MIFNKKSDMQYYLQKIVKEDHHGFKVDNLGSLILNGRYNISKFLAYQNGNWYGSRGDRRGTSENIFEKGKHLFLISPNKFWMRQDDGTVEYSSTSKALSEDAVVFLFAVQKQGVCLYVIDGHKNKSPMMTLMEPDPQSVRLAAVIVIALVRQYDPQSADQMEEFWFSEKTSEEILDESVDRLWSSIQQDEEIQSNKVEKNEDIDLPWD